MDALIGSVLLYSDAGAYDAAASFLERLGGTQGERVWQVASEHGANPTELTADVLKGAVDIGTPVLWAKLQGFDVTVFPVPAKKGIHITLEILAKDPEAFVAAFTRACDHECVRRSVVDKKDVLPIVASQRRRWPRREGGVAELPNGLPVLWKPGRRNDPELPNHLGWLNYWPTDVWTTVGAGKSVRELAVVAGIWKPLPNGLLLRVTRIPTDPRVSEHASVLRMCYELLPAIGDRDLLGDL